MRTTCQSEYGKIKSIFLKSVDDAFIDESTLENEWKALNFLDKPNLSKAKQEYRKFEKLLMGPAIHYFPPDPLVSIDSLYCRDAAIATDHGMIICNMGKPARTHEPEAERKAFVREGLKILGSIKSPGTVEGGDVT